MKVRPQKKQIQIETPKFEWSGVSYAKKQTPWHLNATCFYVNGIPGQWTHRADNDNDVYFTLATSNITVEQANTEQL